MGGSRFQAEVPVGGRAARSPRVTESGEAPGVRVWGRARELGAAPWAWRGGGPSGQERGLKEAGTGVISPHGEVGGLVNSRSGHGGRDGM